MSEFLVLHALAVRERRGDREMDEVVDVVWKPASKPFRPRKADKGDVHMRRGNARNAGQPSSKPWAPVICNMRAGPRKKHALRQT